MDAPSRTAVHSRSVCEHAGAKIGRHGLLPGGFGSGTRWPRTRGRAHRHVNVSFDQQDQTESPPRTARAAPEVRSSCNLRQRQEIRWHSMALNGTQCSSFVYSAYPYLSIAPRVPIWSRFAKYSNVGMQRFHTNSPTSMLMLSTSSVFCPSSSASSCLCCSCSCSCFFCPFPLVPLVPLVPLNVDGMVSRRLCRGKD
jgi:hypothetical protein